MKSRAMVQRANNRLELEEFEVPPLTAETALLRVEACGLCGTDVEQFRGHLTEKGIVRYPLIPGHEPVGIVEEIGADAARDWGVKRGERIALVPHLTCGRCERCQEGTSHLCRSLMPGAAPSYGFLPLDQGHGLWGGYGQYIHLHPRTLFCKVPDNVPARLATLYQALAAGLRWSVMAPNTSFAESVLVLGCGQRGLSCVVALRQAGVARIIVTGLARDAHKLALARHLGASDTIVADQEDVTARVMEVTAGRGVDLAVDLVPVSPDSVVQGIDSLRIGGRMVIAGVKGGRTTVPIDTDKLLFKEISLQGVYSQGVDAYRNALDLLARDLEKLSALRTHDVPLAQAVHGIGLLAGEVPGEEAIAVAVMPWA